MVASVLVVLVIVESVMVGFLLARVRGLRFDVQSVAGDVSLLDSRVSACVAAVNGGMRPAEVHDA